MIKLKTTFLKAAGNETEWGTTNLEIEGLICNFLVGWRIELGNLGLRLDWIGAKYKIEGLICDFWLRLRIEMANLGLRLDCIGAKYRFVVPPEDFFMSIHSMHLRFLNVILWPNENSTLLWFEVISIRISTNKTYNGYCIVACSKHCLSCDTAGKGLCDTNQCVTGYTSTTATNNFCFRKSSFLLIAIMILSPIYGLNNFVWIILFELFYMGKVCRV